MNLEALKERRDELVKDNEWVDDLIKEKEEELWELKVRTIAAQELARSAMQSCLRTTGIVDSFYGSDSQKNIKRKEKDEQIR